MPKEFSRSRRVGEQLQRELAQLLQLEVKDPRVTGVTVQAVQASRDLSVAKVFYTVMGDDNDLAAVQQGLEKSAGFLRRALGQRLVMRHVPSLIFKYDDSVVRGSQLSQLIDEAVAVDRARHKEDED
ncbi:MAG: 30S ribosome-binding factor RbfA [Gammaproteobacteria bacterium]